MLQLCRAVALVVLLPWAGGASAWAAPGGRPALHGVALGMTAPEAAAAGLACAATPGGDLSCRDPAGGATYDVGLSGGTPSIVLRVVETFCSTVPAPAVLHAFMGRFHVAPAAARSDPNGWFFDIGADDEGVLDAALGTCPDGRRRYAESIRDDKLIVFSLKQARRRKKAAGR